MNRIKNRAIKITRSQNYKTYLKEIHKEKWKLFTEEALKALKKAEIDNTKDVINVVAEQLQKDFSYKKNATKFKLKKHLRDLNFPVENDAKLLNKSKEFATVLVSEVWDDYKIDK